MTTTISIEVINGHLKDVCFYPNIGDNRLGIYIDGTLNQYIPLSDNELNAIVKKRDDFHKLHNIE